MCVYDSCSVHLNRKKYNKYMYFPLVIRQPYYPAPLSDACWWMIDGEKRKKDFSSKIKHISYTRNNYGVWTVRLFNYPRLFSRALDKIGAWPLPRDVGLWPRPATAVPASQLHWQLGVDARSTEWILCNALIYLLFLISFNQPPSLHSKQATIPWFIKNRTLRNRW